MKIEGENYLLEANEDATRVTIRGALRLNGLDEYAPVLDALRAGIGAGSGDGRAMTLDLSGLEFLNSSGIAMLSKFVIEARNLESMTLTIRGSATIPWQGKSLKNLQRLWPSLELVLG